MFARTLLIVMYDEHGGFFDHVVPPHTVAPDSHTDHYSFDRLGFRVPAILISPLLNPGVVREVFDHTSLLRMAGGLWEGVQPLGLRAKQANDPLASLTWRASPRRELPRAPLTADVQDVRPTDQLVGFKESLFGLSHHIESLIEHPGRRGRLMARSHEALGGGLSQAKLITDRLDALFEERVAPGLLHRLGNALHQVGRRVGL